MMFDDFSGKLGIFFSLGDRLVEWNDEEPAEESRGVFGVPWQQVRVESEACIEATRLPFGKESFRWCLRAVAIIASADSTTGPWDRGP